jgi:shikimate dehydrogenase
MAPAKPALYAVFGHPVAHSLSPAIHRAGYAALGWTHRHYVPVDVTVDRLAEAVAAFAELGGRGINLTIPLKTAVLDRRRFLDLDTRDAWVLRTGAANTLARRPDGGWEAFNTDGPALHLALARRGARRGRVLVWGSGGAARASVLATLADADSVVVASRHDAPWITDLRRQHVRRVEWAEGDEWVAWADLVVNATPLGQAGAPPWNPPPRFRPGQLAVDWVYGDRPTDFLRRAHDEGAGVVDGRELLVRQAVGAWARWFVEAPPIGAMARAVGLDPEAVEP